MIKKSRSHLNDSNMSYFYHLQHSFYQGTRLIVTGLKSYVHGIFPFVYKYDGPKFIVKLFKELRSVSHMKKLIKTELEND